MNGIPDDRSVRASAITTVAIVTIAAACVVLHVHVTTTTLGRDVDSMHERSRGLELRVQALEATVAPMVSGHR